MTCLKSPDDFIREDLPVSATTLWRLRQSGLPHIKVGRRVLIDVPEAMAWIKTHGSSVLPGIAA